MDKQMGKQCGEIDYNLEPNPSVESTADATGLWFAAAGLCAFLMAGVIVYKAGNSDIRVASNEVVVAAAQSIPTAPAPILPPR